MTILFSLILIAAVELMVFIEAGRVIGAFPVVTLTLLTAVMGLAIIRVQGLTVLLRAEERLRAAVMPAREMFDGFCLAVAGMCLFTPGFATDSIGFILLIPPVRTVLWPFVRNKLIRVGWMEADAGPVVIEGSYTNIKSDDPQKIED
ncbi:MAG: FxsA family protein [Pseudomonadota bacterium]|nr:FxsA family protein [Pseudomonadota bacterium]